MLPRRVIRKRRREGKGKGKKRTRKEKMVKDKMISKSIQLIHGKMFQCQLIAIASRNSNTYEYGNDFLVAILQIFQALYELSVLY